MKTRHIFEKLVYLLPIFAIIITFLFYSRDYSPMDLNTQIFHMILDTYYYSTPNILSPNTTKFLFSIIKIFNDTAADLHLIYVIKLLFYILAYPLITLLVYTKPQIFDQTTFLKIVTPLYIYLLPVASLEIAPLFSTYIFFNLVQSFYSLNKNESSNLFIAPIFIVIHYLFLPISQYSVFFLLCLFFINYEKLLKWTISTTLISFLLKIITNNTHSSFILDSFDFFKPKTSYSETIICILILFFSYNPKRKVFWFLFFPIMIFASVSTVSDLDMSNNHNVRDSLFIVFIIFAVFFHTLKDRNKGDLFNAILIYFFVHNSFYITNNTLLVHLRKNDKIANDCKQYFNTDQLTRKSPAKNLYKYSLMNNSFNPNDILLYDFLPDPIKNRDCLQAYEKILKETLNH